MGDNTWQSTGYFLAAGEILTVTIIQGSYENWALRIGCHKDSIAHHDIWKRYPEITKEENLKSNNHKITSAFGGLIYLVSKNGAGKNLTI